MYFTIFIEFSEKYNFIYVLILYRNYLAGSSNCILAGAMCPDLSEFNKAVVANHNQQPLILL